MWKPKEQCLTRLSIPNALERYTSTPRYIKLLVAAEDMIEWARRDKPVELPEFTGTPRLKLTAATAYVLGRQMIKRLPSILIA